MRKFYNKFFRIPINGKIREKVMFVRVAVMAAIMIICLAAMSITAYAYFSCNVTSGSNAIKAAVFEPKISIEFTDANGGSSQIIPISVNDCSYKARLNVGNVYKIKIELTNDCTANTGYLIVKSDDCPDAYHTQQLGIDSTVSGGKTETITFNLTVTDETDVIFQSNWGTSSYYDEFKNTGVNKDLYIIQNEQIKMIINGIVNPLANTQDEAEKDEEPILQNSLSPSYKNDKKVISPSKSDANKKENVSSEPDKKTEDASKNEISSNESSTISSSSLDSLTSYSTDMSSESDSVSSEVSKEPEDVSSEQIDTEKPIDEVESKEESTDSSETETNQEESSLVENNG